MKKGRTENQCGKDQPDAEVAALLRGFCFQRRSSPACPKANRVLPPKSERRESLEGSSNATTSEETDPGPYVEGALTQDGGCVRRRVRKAGLSAMSACWHSEGVKGPRVEEAPVGMPLIRRRDHLTFSREVTGRGDESWERKIDRASEMKWEACVS